MSRMKPRDAPRGWRRATSAQVFTNEVLNLRRGKGRKDFGFCLRGQISQSSSDDICARAYGDECDFRPFEFGHRLRVQGDSIPNQL